MGWVLEDNNKGLVTVSEGKKVELAYEKAFYKKKKIEFWLLFNQQHKAIGYKLIYSKEGRTPRFAVFNSFGIVYYDKVEEYKPKFDLIYEDQIVRLGFFEHKNKVRDYWLVGKWRTDTSDA